MRSWTTRDCCLRPTGLGRPAVKGAVSEALDLVRRGEVPPAAAADLAVALLPRSVASLRPVLNCTGVVLHTNLGRAPLSRGRGPRGRAGRRLHRRRAGPGDGRSAAPAAQVRSPRCWAAVPDAEQVLVVNNGAAALVLATTALAQDREVLVSRGELVEIGDGFRLPDLITLDRRPAPRGRHDEPHPPGGLRRRRRDRLRPEGAPEQLHDVRLHLVGRRRRAAGAGRARRRRRRQRPARARPAAARTSPTSTSALRAGADVVTCSGDKLLGGPQAGLVFGSQAAVERLRRHPMYRAVPLRQAHPRSARGDAPRPGHPGLAGAAGRGPRAALRAAGREGGRRGRRHDGVRRRRRRTGRRAAQLGGGTRPGPGGRPADRRPGRRRSGAPGPAAARPPLRAPDGGRRRRGGGAGVHVVATAGHVDHGKSTLVRALTGMEPDRWAEERRRGMTIDLGFAWTTLPSGEVVGFVDVPGHQRFLGNMLAGIGPSPAVLFVVAADEGWGRQSAEHLAAIDGLGLRARAAGRHPLRPRRPGGARWQQARREIAGSSLGEVPAVAVSGTTGQGMDELRQALRPAGVDAAGAGDRRAGPVVGGPRVHDPRAPARSSPALSPVAASPSATTCSCRTARPSSAGCRAWGSRSTR